MKSREVFEAVRDRKNPFGLRFRLVLFVTLEIEICILIAVGLDALLKQVIHIPFELPLIVELIAVTLLIGILVTSQLSKYFFDPIKKLGEAMETDMRHYSAPARI